MTDEWNEFAQPAWDTDGKNKPDQQLRDDGNINRYFHVMLNMADDDLNPYQYRLLGHYRRVCGLSGACWESTRTTAKVCKMSTGKVSSTRKELVEAGYIKLEYREDDTCLITVIDRMPENVTRYTKRSPDEQGVHSMNVGVHHMKQRRIIEEEPIKDSATQGARRKAKPRTPRPTPQTYAEKSGLSEDALEANKRRLIEESTAQSKRHIAANTDFDTLIQEVRAIPGVSGKLAIQYAHMLSGTAQKGDYKTWNLETPITSAQFRLFVIWYFGKYPTQGLPKVPKTLHGYICEWQESGGNTKPQNGTQQNQTDLDRAAQSSTDSQDEAAAYWREHPDEYATYAAQYPQGGLF